MESHPWILYISQSFDFPSQGFPEHRNRRARHEDSESGRTRRRGAQVGDYTHVEDHDLRSIQGS